MALRFNGLRAEFNSPLRLQGTIGRLVGESVPRFNQQTAFDNESATPSGGGSAAYVYPRSPGALASFTLVKGGLSGALSLTPAIGLTCAITGQVTSSASLDSNVPIAANMTASISTTASLLKAIAAMSASNTMTGTLTGQCGAIVSIQSSMVGFISNATVLRADAFMTCVIGGPSILSPEGLAIAVWEKDLGAFNTIGTSGKIVKDAASAGNPWSADVASNSSPGTFGAIVQKLISVSKFIGLK